MEDGKFRIDATTLFLKLKGMAMTKFFVAGIPYGKRKVRGNREGPTQWTRSVKGATRGLDTINGPCRLDVDFILPASKFPSDVPFGSDLDNLLKNLLDALGKTILRNAEGRDSAILEINARKRKARPGERTGARISLSRVKSPAWRHQ